MVKINGCSGPGHVKFCLLGESELWMTAKANKQTTSAKNPRSEEGRTWPTRTVDGEPSTIVQALDPEVLAMRREVILANRRARKAAKPAYINIDAACRDGLAGLAYVGALGTRMELVPCEDNHAGEYLALLMAMEDAERCLAGRIAFRSDSQRVVNLKPGTDGQFEYLRKRVKLLLARHPEWTLVLVEGKRNRTADELSRRALGQASLP
jgi:ribonuclease HI